MRPDAAARAKTDDLVRGFRGFFGFPTANAGKLSAASSPHHVTFDSFMGVTAGKPRNPLNPLTLAQHARHRARDPPR